MLQTPGALLPSSLHLLQTVPPIICTANKTWHCAWEKSEQTNPIFPWDSLSGKQELTFLERMYNLGRSGYWEVTSVSVWLLLSWKTNGFGCRARSISLCLEWINLQLHSVCTIPCNTGIPSRAVHPCKLSLLSLLSLSLLQFFHSKKIESKISMNIYKPHIIWTDSNLP